MTRLNRRTYGAALPAPGRSETAPGLFSRIARLIGGKPRRRRTLNG